MHRAGRLYLLLPLLLGAACHSISSSGSDDGGTDSGTDADTDVDTDADSDSDACLPGPYNWIDIGDCGTVPEAEVIESPVVDEQPAFPDTSSLPCDDPDELTCFFGYDNFILVVSGENGLAAVNEAIQVVNPDFVPVEVDLQTQRMIVFGGTVLHCGSFNLTWGEDYGVDYDIYEWPDERLHFETTIWGSPPDYFPDAEGFYLMIGASLVVNTDQDPTVCLSL